MHASTRAGKASYVGVLHTSGLSSITPQSVFCNNVGRNRVCTENVCVVSSRLNPTIVVKIRSTGRGSCAKTTDRHGDSRSSQFLSLSSSGSPLLAQSLPPSGHSILAPPSHNKHARPQGSGFGHTNRGVLVKPSLHVAWSWCRPAALSRLASTCLRRDPHRMLSRDEARTRLMPLVPCVRRCLATCSQTLKGCT